MTTNHECKACITVDAKILSDIVKQHVDATFVSLKKEKEQDKHHDLFTFISTYKNLTIVLAVLLVSIIVGCVVLYYYTKPFYALQQHHKYVDGCILGKMHCRFETSFIVSQSFTFHDPKTPLPLTYYCIPTCEEAYVINDIQWIHSCSDSGFGYYLFNRTAYELTLK